MGGSTRWPIAHARRMDSARGARAVFDVVVSQPSDLHDAIWGIFAAVYGGAVHPTAEGHAAMADAALPAAREVLGLPAPSALVRNEPLPALPNLPPPRLPTSGR